MDMKPITNNEKKLAEWRRRMEVEKHNATLQNYLKHYRPPVSMTEKQKAYYDKHKTLSGFSE